MVADLAENLDENISGSDGPQKGQASIASKSDEMEMPLSIAATEIVGHGTQPRSKPRPFETREGSATRKFKIASEDAPPACPNFQMTQLSTNSKAGAPGKFTRKV